jgi:hypothetical protein
MMRLLSLAAMVLVTAAPLAAQTRRGLAEVDEPGMRRGFWLQLGAGAGREELKLDGDPRGWSDPLWAPTLNLRAGATLGDHVRLGVDLNGWIRPEGDFTESLGSVMPVLQLYPSAHTGLHVRGGGGYAWSSVTDEFVNFTSTLGGFGTVVGVGWELPVGRKVFLTPYVDWYQYWIQSRTVGDFQERVISFGLGITFQPAGR